MNTLKLKALVFCALLCAKLFSQEITLVNDFDTADINTTLSVNAPGLLLNDSITDSYTLTSFSVNGIDFPTGTTASLNQGSVTINQDGGYVFVPNNNYSGDITDITYTVSDGINSFNAQLKLTVENTTDLIEVFNVSTCNQGFTTNDEYKILYYLTIRNNSNARDFHENSFIKNINLTNDIESTFGVGCVTSIEAVELRYNTVEDYINNPYPQDFSTNSFNPDYLAGTSNTVFSNDAMANSILYPRQSMTLILCVNVNAFCNGRPNPTPSGSGIDFNNVFEVTSNKGNSSRALNLTDFHTPEAIVTAGLYIEENSPAVRQDATYNYTNTIIISNEGNATANNINYNMGLSSFLDKNMTFENIEITQTSGPNVIVNPNFNGDSEPKLLASNNNLAPGEIIILEVNFTTAPSPSSVTGYYNQLNYSQTQGSLDGIDETNPLISRRSSFVIWSDNQGEHLDAYYPISSSDPIELSLYQCNCNTAAMEFKYTKSVATNLSILETNTSPNNILEHEEITFEYTITNTSQAIELNNLEVANNVDNICTGNIISVSIPKITNSSATINPNINTAFDGTINTQIFDGNSGVLEANQSITIQYTVLLYEHCIGNNIINFSADDAFGDSINSSTSIRLNIATDSDGDSIPNYIDIDDDNDTILDITETNGLNPLDDDDSDLIPNYRDTDYGIDANNNGIVDVFDFDNDGVPNHLDLDSDNDGIYDLEEVNNSFTSADSDGMAGDNVGNNGLHNDIENNDTTNATITYTLINTDNTGNPNYLDIDSDDDGIVDTIEAQSTFNYTALSTTVNEYGVNTAYPEGITPIDTDNDGINDYIDNNSDNDIREDYIEAWDTNNDGTPETTFSNSDVDNDGLDDAYDTNNTILNADNGQTPNNFPNIDNSDNPEKDWREIMAIVVVIDNITNTEGGDFEFTLNLVTKNDNSIPVQSASDITIIFNTENGSENSSTYNIATAPFDYNSITNSTFTIPAYTNIITFSVSSTDDNIYEQDEKFSLSGNITSNNTINNEIIGIGTILDNETPPTININNLTVNEGDDFNHEVTISHPSSTPIEIEISTQDNSAVSPNDYENLTTTLIIDGTENPNSPNTTASFSFSTFTDNTNEIEQEELLVNLNTTSNNTSNSNFSFTNIIEDIDPNPLLSIEDVIVTEGQPLVFTITLLNTDNEPMFNYRDIPVTIETFDDSANYLEDYKAVNTNTEISANSESLHQNIITIDDKLNENTESLFVRIETASTDISNTNNYILATGSIKDNDIPNLFSPNDDGVSDEFKINGIEEFPNFKLTIFDRWGSEIYAYNNEGRTNPIWWNGRKDGKIVPVGVYYYTLDYNDGTTKPTTSFIQLVR